MAVSESLLTGSPVRSEVDHYWFAGGRPGYVCSPLLVPALRSSLSKACEDDVVPQPRHRVLTRQGRCELHRIVSPRARGDVLAW